MGAGKPPKAFYNLRSHRVAVLKKKYVRYDKHDKHKVRMLEHFLAAYLHIFLLGMS